MHITFSNILGRFKPLPMAILPYVPCKSWIRYTLIDTKRVPNFVAQIRITFGYVQSMSMNAHVFYLIFIRNILAQTHGVNYITVPYCCIQSSIINACCICFFIVNHLSSYLMLTFSRQTRHNKAASFISFQPTDNGIELPKRGWFAWWWWEWCGWFLWTERPLRSFFASLHFFGSLLIIMIFYFIITSIYFSYTLIYRYLCSLTSTYDKRTNFTKLLWHGL